MTRAKLFQNFEESTAQAPWGNTIRGCGKSDSEFWWLFSEDSATEWKQYLYFKLVASGQMSSEEFWQIEFQCTTEGAVYRLTATITD